MAKGAYRSPASTQALLTGVKECDRMLKAVGNKIGNRAARAVLGKAVRLAAKRIKAKATKRSVKQAIAGNVKKRKGGQDKGLITAKAGAGVGGKSKRKPAKRSTSRGVGISANNVHWYILGTADRRRKTAMNPPTGRMPRHDIVKEAMAGGATEVINLIKKELPKRLEEEVKKEMVKRFSSSKRAR